MIRNCAKTCHVCGPGDPCIPQSVDRGLLQHPGDLINLFTRAENHTQLRPKVLSTDPPVLLYDRFLSEEEADELLSVIISDEGSRSKWGLSLVGNVPLQLNVTQATRTSSTRLCLDSCLNSAIAKTLDDRVHLITGADINHFEYPQALHYAEEQFYKEHSDWSDTGLYTPAGPRVLTLFVYLNDVKGGGETNFTQLDRKSVV